MLNKNAHSLRERGNSHRRTDSSLFCVSIVAREERGSAYLRYVSDRGGINRDLYLFVTHAQT